MKRTLQGHYETVSTFGERVQSFVPKPLPPEPGIEWTTELREQFNRAHVALGRLDSISIMLPDISPVLYMYVRKEAVVSSMIEGTQSSISDLLLYEIDEEPGVPLEDVQEVSNYVAALNFGLERLQNDLPISLRLFREIHQVLLSKGRGHGKLPGEFRRSQNWIGGTRPGVAKFVPPPPHLVMPCLDQLEKYLHDLPETTPVLLKAALSHVQFETIHPFLDGNGRLGRIMITLLLCESGMMKLPLLYLSLYFKMHRQQYYDLLNEVRISGDWEAWLGFFASAIEETANQGVETVQQLVALHASDQLRVAMLGRSAKSAKILLDALFERPIATATWLSQKTGITAATVNRALQRLCDLGLVHELTARRRSRIYAYRKYLDILNQGAELPDDWRVPPVDD